MKEIGYNLDYSENILAYVIKLQCCEVKITKIGLTTAFWAEHSKSNCDESPPPMFGYRSPSLEILLPAVFSTCSNKRWLLTTYNDRAFEILVKFQVGESFSI